MHDRTCLSTLRLPEGNPARSRPSQVKRRHLLSQQTIPSPWSTARLLIEPVSKRESHIARTGTREVLIEPISKRVTHSPHRNARGPDRTHLQERVTHSPHRNARGETQTPHPESSCVLRLSDEFSARAAFDLTSKGDRETSVFLNAPFVLRWVGEFEGVWNQLFLGV